ncbi:isochorismatase family cysteine hydrolase [Robertmurraya korlensis]|uniref:isochorismatase family cysteine hydrolase n=1 Tax=Robertmurraya korlensis TaxID=519977 RepID=UPI0008248897|nr:isochorismatase family cysteine hydrolase [Robertmurraya korlensis]
MGTYENKSQKALLIIDMINNFDFSNGEVLAKKTLPIAKNIQRLKEQFTNEGLPIIYINDHYNLWQADVQRIISHCQNSLSQEIIKTIQPNSNDLFLIKPKHSAFFGTALNTLLYQLNIRSLVITGIAGNICVLFTANDAYMREYSIHVPHNAIASVDDQDNEYSLKMIKNVLKGKIDPL